MTARHASTFLVERYIPLPTGASLAASVARLANACKDSERQGSDEVTYLHSTYLPAEDICFCVFQALTSAAVELVNHAADFRVDRVTEVHPLYPLSLTGDEA